MSLLRLPALLPVLLFVCLAGGCGGGGSGSDSGPRSLVSVQVSPAALTVPKGVTKQLQATAIFSDQTTQDVSALAVWSSSDSEVARVYSGGLATAVEPGESTIIASFGGKSGEQQLRVTAAELERIEVSSSASLAEGMSREFKATGIFTDRSVQDLTYQVEWKSSAPEVVTVFPGGIATFLSKGQATISATFQALSSPVTGSTEVSVTDAVLVAIEITPMAATIPVGTMQKFTATGIFSDNTTRVLPYVTWTSSDSNVASISVMGTATGKSAGTTEINATVGSVTGSATLTVTDAALVAIQVTPNLKTITTGTTASFSATGIFSDNSSHDITGLATWYSSSESVAAVSNGASKGTATALSAGNTTISAALRSVTGSTELRVSNPQLVSLVVTTLNPNQNPLNEPPPPPLTVLGNSISFQATAVYDDKSEQDVTAFATWSSSEPSVANVSNVSGSRGMTTPLSAGQAGITATFGGMSFTQVLTVRDPSEIQSLTVTPPLSTIARGTEQKFRATLTLTDNSAIDVTGSAFWSSSNPEVAPISNASAGVATGVSAGSTTITATFAGKSTAATLTVTGPNLTSLRINPETITIGVGTTTVLVLTADYSDGSSQTVNKLATWKSSNESSVKTDNTAKGVVAGVSTGSAFVRATFGGLQAEATVTVTGSALASIQIDPVTAKLAQGTSRQFSAIGVYADGTVQDLTSQATWSSTDPSVASVGTSTGGWGRATALSPGMTTIQATFRSVTGSAALEVTNASLVSIQVTPFLTSIPRGFTQQFFATGLFSDNTAQDLTELVTWSTSDPTRAVVTNVAGSQGHVTAISTGSFSVRATFGSVTSP